MGPVVVAVAAGPVAGRAPARPDPSRALLAVVIAVLVAGGGRWAVVDLGCNKGFVLMWP